MLEVADESLSASQRDELHQKFALLWKRFLRNEISEQERTDELTSLLAAMEKGLSAKELSDLYAKLADTRNKEFATARKEGFLERND